MNGGTVSKVLIVGDAAVRSSLREGLSRYPEIRLRGSEPDPRTARDMIVGLVPDLVLLSIDSPRMDTLSFLRRIMKHFPLPVIGLSACGPGEGGQADEALACGVRQVIRLPADDRSDPDFAQRVALAIHKEIAAWSSPRSTAPAFGLPRRELRPPLPDIGRTLLAVGASTGGANALQTLLSALPETFPGTVIVQHMPKHFTAAFARRLDSLGPLEVVEAKDGDSVRPGRALIAPGDQHMVVEMRGLSYVVRLHSGAAVHHQRPAVDVLFRSVATVAGANALGVLLTGMGCDGARGLLAIRKRGGRTIAQDEQTSVIFGMPKEAIRLGAAQKILPLPMIAPTLERLLQGPRRRRSA